MLNPNSSNVKKWITLLVVSVVAATAVPSAALGEEDVSGEITVGVVITEADNPCVAAITITSDGQLAPEIRANVNRLVDEPLLWDIFVFPFRNLPNRQEAVDASLDALDSARNQVMLELSDIAATSVDYASGDPALIALVDHPADLNDDGIFDLTNDVPAYLQVDRRTFESDNFNVAYETGTCDVNAPPIYGLLSVKRSNLEKQSIDSVTQEVSWNSVEVTDPYTGSLEDFDGTGVAALRSVEFYTPSFGSDFARSPNTILEDPVAFGFGGNHDYYAEVTIAGSGPMSLGSYRVQYDFMLEIMERSLAEENYQPVYCWFNVC